MRSRRLLTVSHSYVVALNRRLAHEMAEVGQGRWEVTAVAPSFFRGDLRDIWLERRDDERNALEPVAAYLSALPHLFFFSSKLRRLARRRDWDLIHCWEEPYVVAGAQIAWSIPREVPLVMVTAQNLSKRYPPPFQILERWTLSRARACIALGQRVVSNVSVRPGYVDKPVRFIPMGVDLERFCPSPEQRTWTRRELGFGPGPPVIGYLGRFVAAKGVPFLLRVLERLRRPWRGLFVGGGPLEGELHRWAERRGDQVRVVTGVAHDEVPRHLNAMDLLCAPSQTTRRWKEQFGRMLVEGLACGVPVLGSDSGEIPCTLGDAGLVLGEKDMDGWAAAIDQLLEQPERRAELSARGRERAVNTYSWPVVAKAHLDFFEELLAG